MSNKSGVAALLVSALVITGFSSTAFAQGMQSMAMEKKGGAMGKTAPEKAGNVETGSIVAENDKLSVRDSQFKPGAIAAMHVRLGLLSIHLSPMTAERTFEDGTKQVIHFKAGQVELVSETRAFSSKNIGTNTAHLLAIHLK